MLTIFFLWSKVLFYVDFFPKEKCFLLELFAKLKSQKLHIFALESSSALHLGQYFGPVTHSFDVIWNAF